MQFRQEQIKDIAVKLFCISVLAAGVYLFAEYLWGTVLPFVLAYLFAECFKPVVRYSEKNKRFPKRFFVLLLVLLTATAIFGLICAAAREIYFELRNIFAGISAIITKIQTDDGYASSVIEKIGSFIPFADIRPKLWEMRGNLNEELYSMIISAADKFTGSVISLIGNAVTFFPDALLTAAVFIIATYYFAIDRVKINCFFLSLFPVRLRPKLKKAKEELGSTVGKFIRAYGLIFIITFSELLISFLIIGVKYAFVTALATSIVDILPVVGTGTVLLPWGIIEILYGNYGKGTALLAVYAVITVIRQIIEPKIVGKFIGLSPIASLASMYIGLKLCGITGLIAFPLGAIIIKRLKLGSEDQLRQSTNETLTTSGSDESAETSL